MDVLFSKKKRVNSLDEMLIWFQQKQLNYRFVLNNTNDRLIPALNFILDIFVNDCKKLAFLLSNWKVIYDLSIQQMVVPKINTVKNEQIQHILSLTHQEFDILNFDIQHRIFVIIAVIDTVSYCRLPQPIRI